MTKNKVKKILSITAAAMILITSLVIPAAAEESRIDYLEVNISTNSPSTDYYIYGDIQYGLAGQRENTIYFEDTRVKIVYGYQVENQWLGLCAIFEVTADYTPSAGSTELAKVNNINVSDGQAVIGKQIQNIQFPTRHNTSTYKIYLVYPLENEEIETTNAFNLKNGWLPGNIFPSESEDYLNGYNAGLQQGLRDGEEIGYQRGYEDGFNDGKSIPRPEVNTKSLYYGATLSISGTAPNRNEVSTQFTVNNIAYHLNNGALYFTADDVDQTSANLFSNFNIEMNSIQEYTLTINLSEEVNVNNYPFPLLGEDDYKIKSFTVTDMKTGAVIALNKSWNSNKNYNEYKMTPGENQSGPIKAITTKTITLTMDMNAGEAIVTTENFMINNIKLGENDFRFNEGYWSGYYEGIGEAQKSYQNGYITGKAEGLKAAQSADFTSLFSAVIGAPVNAFQSLFSFEVLGMDMRGFVGSLLMCAVVLIIIKIFL